jgi:hypothetical protein
MRLERHGRLVAILAALVAGSLLVAGPVHATQVTVQVNSSPDDYKQSLSGASTRLDTTFDPWTTSDLYEALRFVSVQVPQGAVITSATLQVYSPATGASNSLSGVASGENVGNAPAWTGTNYEISSAPKTSASVAISGLPTWTANAFNDMADVTTIVQEIVNRCDWTQGNALKIFLLASSTSSHRRTYTYDNDPSRAAKLIIDYTGCDGRTIELSTRDGAAESIDLGWTGIGHNGPSFAREGTLSATLSSCANSSPPCGACDFSGPVQNACTSSNRRCTNNTRTKCTSNAQCSGGGTCEYFFGSYVPVPSSLPFCVANQVSGTLSGAVDLSAGDTAIDVPITSTFSLGLCPTCVGDGAHNDGVAGGTCSGGPNNGLSCDVNGLANVHAGYTSLDCPPSAGFPRSNALDAGTDSVTKTLSASNPNCTGKPGSRCFCDTCNNVFAQPCSTNADCPQNPVGTAGICGGRRCLGGTNNGAACTTNSQCPGSACSRPGEPTQPNPCADDTSTPGVEGCELSGGEYVCTVGPTDQFCTTARYQGCMTNTDCATAGIFVCSNDGNRGCGANADCVSPGTCTATASCTAAGRPCYEDNGGVGGTVTAVGATATPVNEAFDATLANQFVCTGPVGVQSFDTSVGLPGLTRVELPVRVKVRR